MPARMRSFALVLLGSGSGDMFENNSGDIRALVQRSLRCSCSRHARDISV